MLKELFAEESVAEEDPMYGRNRTSSDATSTAAGFNTVQCSLIPTTLFDHIRARFRFLHLYRIRSPFYPFPSNTVVEPFIRYFCHFATVAYCPPRHPLSPSSH